MDRNDAINELEKYKLTNFQKKVLIATISIKKGETRTYKQIAQMIGHGSAYRAVGSALKINPLAPDIPCCSVIKSDGSIGNYSGKGGPSGKLLMLKKEGAL